MNEIYVNNIISKLFTNNNGKSFVYMKNSKGPRIDPCGTPILINVFRNLLSFTSTLLNLLYN